MLSIDQQLHFAEHGWLILEDVLDERPCQSYRQALDRCAERYLSTQGHFREQANPKRLDNTILYDNLFLDWLKLPGVVDANRAIIGTDVRATEYFAYISQPDEDRHTRRDELMNPDRWKWHRGFRPRFGLLPHEDDARLVNCLYTTNICYLTPVSAGNGSTAVLDGSHRIEGDYAALKERCPIRQADVAAGSVLIIAETLMHSQVPIVSEQTRYALFYCFVPPWYASWPGYDAPRLFVESLADEELRALLGPPHYGGQPAPRRTV